MGNQQCLFPWAPIFIHHGGMDYISDKESLSMPHVRNEEGKGGAWGLHGHEKQATFMPILAKFWLS